ncbi:MAG: serine protease [Opitutaceae bacterium]|nr:serine protease [Opitutaceae bacterium]
MADLRRCRKNLNMPLTPSEQLQFSTTRIVTKSATGATGSGTGFFATLLKNGDSQVPVLVTNKHVVQGAVQGLFRLTTQDAKGEPAIGRTIDLDLGDFEKRWIPHPDAEVDLAVMPVGPLLTEAAQKGFTVFYKAPSAELIARPEDLSQLSAMEELLMIGYPIGLWDQKNNLPIFRRGITATHPAFDFNGKSEFAIDCACFPGSSGSPVFLFNTGSYYTKNGDTVIGSRLKLLGILYAGPQYTSEGKIVVKDVPTAQTAIPVSSSPINLGYVVKAHRLLEFEPIIEAMLKKNG